jgi:hypothetical protein
MDTPKFKKLRIQTIAGNYEWIYINTSILPALRIAMSTTGSGSTLQRYYTVTITSCYPEVTIGLFTNESDAIELADRISGYYKPDPEAINVINNGTEGPRVTEIESTVEEK